MGDSSTRLPGNSDARQACEDTAVAAGLRWGLPIQRPGQRSLGGANRAATNPGLVPVIIAPELNGLLLNWYDGQLGHYIGRHRDSTHDLVPNSSIVTVSLGEERVFRLGPWPHQPESKPSDFRTSNGSVFILPWDTNRSFTHEVTASRRLTGRRISVTLRAFQRSTDAETGRHITQTGIVTEESLEQVSR